MKASCAYSASTAPIEPGRLLVPIRAIDRGLPWLEEPVQITDGHGLMPSLLAAKGVLLRYSIAIEADQKNSFH